MKDYSNNKWDEAEKAGSSWSAKLVEVLWFIATAIVFAYTIYMWGVA